MYYTVRMGDRNYGGVADRFNHPGQWDVLARLNNYATLRIGQRIRIPDSWTYASSANINQGGLTLNTPKRRGNAVPRVWQGQVAGVPNRRVPPVWQGQVAGAPDMFQGSVTRQFGVGQELDATGTGITQEDCLVGMEALKATDNAVYTNLVEKYGKESADRRWDLMSKAGCVDKEYMIQLPWLKLVGAVALGVVLGAGATYGIQKIVE